MSEDDQMRASYTALDRRRTRAFVRALALILPILLVAPAAAEPRKPLLIAGKKTLYERVLTRPGALLRSAPGTGTDAGGRPVAPLSLFYVYGRSDASGGTWLEVGGAPDGRIDGWIEASRAIAWRHMLGVNFTNPANRGRVLFFGERAALESVVGAPDPGDAAAALRAAVLQGAPPSAPVVAIEPAEHIDIRKKFYLLPIVDAVTRPSSSGFDVRLLEVASATPDADPARADAGKIIREKIDVRDFRAGLVFVIDASKSMGPYIERTRQAVQKVYDVIAGSEWKQQFSFGLVAFRDSTKNRPGLEYVSRVFASLADGTDPARFLERTKVLTPTAVSSENFYEDSFSGVKMAIEDIDWTPYQGRFVVLVTDAGSRAAGDPQSGTRMDGDQLRSLAEKKGITIYALHLLTAEGKSDHARAKKQYRALTSRPSLGRALYFPIDAGALETFGERVDTLAQAIVANVGRSARGELTGADGAAQAPQAGADASQRQMIEDTGKVFREMQLAYLGSKSGTEAPALLQAWAADRDFANPQVRSLDVRVLLTKNQLSDLQQALQDVLESGEATRISPKDFFDRVQEAALRAGRGTRISGDGGPGLAQTGLLGEYLDGLPYRSRVMQLTADDWLSWSYGEQREFLDEVRSKIQAYREFHDDTDLWIDLGRGGSAGDWVYPVPLDDLP